MISAVLIPKLRERFPARGLRVGSPPEPCAVFPAAHPEVGDVQIYDDGGELTVEVGKFTHGHFANYDAGLSDDEKAERIAEAVAGFLDDLFADRVMLWGSHRGSGGWQYLGCEAVLSPLPPPGTTYVWSGPLPGDD